MADRIYQKATPVTAGVIQAKKGVMIVGGGTADLKFYKEVDYNSDGSTLSGMGLHSATDHFQTFTGTVQGAVIPVQVHTLVRADAGTTVYRLG
jgi:hypothetical protein